MSKNICSSCFVAYECLTHKQILKIQSLNLTFIAFNSQALKPGLKAKSMGVFEVKQITLL